MTPDFIVRPYAGGDKLRLVELMRQVWSHKVDVDRQVERRWWWRFPAPPICLVEDHAQRLVGVCAYLPFALRTRGQELPGAWFVDFFVLAECQGNGLGTRLTKYVQDQFAITASLSQTAMAYRVFEKLGWSPRAGVTMYMNPWPMRWLLRSASPEMPVSTVTIDRTISGDDVDAVWARVRDAYEAIGVRSGAGLIERYAGRPGRTYQLLRAYRGQECAGYMLVRTVDAAGGGGATLGLIVDYLVAPDDASAFSALLSTGANLLLDRGARKIACIATVPAFQRILGSNGFCSPATPLAGRAFRHNIKWLTYYSKVDRALVDPSAWFLTMADCDIDEAWQQP